MIRELGQVYNALTLSILGKFKINVGAFGLYISSIALEGYLNLATKVLVLLGVVLTVLKNLKDLKN